MQVECANILKKKKSLCVSWNNNDSTNENDEDDEYLSNYVTFMSKVVIKVANDFDNPVIVMLNPLKLDGYFKDYAW